ncbi:uncharacterized protein PHALS_14620 [Plasmopara halstedii]|uniref:Uncharacterized protein n=1 Tax=Plasmopara halstedii TaxID=4781 RepID=A0A0P1AME4_PLAHL|nr:uncharacterized protein PHALS_14620 [Plasmopara halstedii]CEG42332.1 hypothetical protein PHALS_14620 [Plasmopara halstedii]|eukprot:XP_024578701.1 hypothetical protein PHALS_14620 [Plasmopara halstedii]
MPQIPNITPHKTWFLAQTVGYITQILVEEVSSKKLIFDFAPKMIKYRVYKVFLVTLAVLLASNGFAIALHKNITPTETARTLSSLDGVESSKDNHLRQIEENSPDDDERKRKLPVGGGPWVVGGTSAGNHIEASSGHEKKKTKHRKNKAYHMVKRFWNSG